jgi:hypothetical protein
MQHKSSLSPVVPPHGIIGSDDFRSYALYVLLVSLPFFAALRPKAVVYTVVSVLYGIYLFRIWILVAIIGVLLCGFVLRRKAPLLGHVIAEVCAKIFIVLYGLLPIGIALSGLHASPCGGSIGIGCVSVVTSYSDLGNYIRILLGIAMSGYLLMSVFYFKTTSSRWRVFMWSLPLWILLATASFALSGKTCVYSPCYNSGNK